MSVKNLAFTNCNLLVQAAYQITPLLNSSLAAIYYPKMKGYFVGPSFDYSFTDNLYASIVVQTFGAEIENLQTFQKERITATYGFLRLKWNF